jgi:hypothetical protein
MPKLANGKQKKPRAKIVNDHARKTYDRVAFAVRKGHKEKIKAHAVSLGYSGIQQYLIALVNRDMDTDVTQPIQSEAAPAKSAKTP